MIQAPVESHHGDSNPTLSRLPSGRVAAYTLVASRPREDSNLQVPA